MLECKLKNCKIKNITVKHIQTYGEASSACLKCIKAYANGQYNIYD